MASNSAGSAPHLSLEPAQLALPAPNDEDVKLADLELQLAQAKVEKLEKEIQAARTRREAAKAASSSWEAPLPVAAKEEVAVDEEKVQHLVEMGFSRRRSIEALDLSGGRTETAIAQLLIPEEQTPLQQLEAMGFSSGDAMRALKSGNVDQAVEELLSQRVEAEAPLALPDLPADPEELENQAIFDDVFPDEDAVPSDQEVMEQLQALEDGALEEALLPAAQEAMEEQAAKAPLPSPNAGDANMEEKAAEAPLPPPNAGDANMEEKAAEAPLPPPNAGDANMEEKVAEAPLPPPNAGDANMEEALPAAKQAEAREDKKKRRRQGDAEAAGPSSAAPKAKAAKSKAPKASAKSKAAGSLMDALAEVAVDPVQFQARPKRRGVAEEDALCVAKTVLQRDKKMTEAAKKMADRDAGQMSTDFKARKRYRLSHVLDGLGWLKIILKHGNAAFFKSLAEAKFRLPWVVQVILGRESVDWAKPVSIQKLQTKLAEAQQLWADVKKLPEPDHGYLWQERGAEAHFHKVDMSALATPWWDEDKQAQEILLDLANHYPMLRDQIPETEPTTSIRFKEGATCTVQNPRPGVAREHQMRWVLGPDGVARRQAQPNPNAVRNSVDIKNLFVQVLQDIQVHWAFLRDDLLMFSRLLEIRSESNPNKTRFFGEKFIPHEFQAFAGARPEDVVASHFQDNSWRPVQQSDLGGRAAPQDGRRDGGLVIPGGADSVTVLRDSEDQLRALIALGVVERRQLLSTEEKMMEAGELRFALHVSSANRTHWYCEACDRWLETSKSVIHRHRCNAADVHNALYAAVALRGMVTSRPREFHLVKGEDLGCFFKLSGTSNRRSLEVFCPIRHILQVSEYAAGVSSSRLKAFVRVIGREDDDEVRAEQDMAQEDAEADGDKEKEDEEEAAASSAAPPKRRRAESLPGPGAVAYRRPEPQSAAGAAKPRFSLLSCGALAEAPAKPSGFRLPLHPAQRRTVFWMASREGVKVPGFDSSDTEFPGFVSVQRLSRQLGKSDVKVQVKVERLFSNAKGGLLADAVGYGKTAAVLALVALTRHQPCHAAAPPELLKSKATLVMLPANLFDQWQGEIKKFLSNDFKIVSIPSLVSLKKVTVGELRSADIVLVSLRLLVSAKYQELLDQSVGHLPREEVLTPAQKQFDDALEKWNKHVSNKALYDQQLALARMHANAARPLPFIPGIRDPGPLPPRPKVEDFQDKMGKKPPETSSKRLVQRRALLRRALAQMSKAKQEQLDDMTMPPLELFCWRRLVVDELHEPLRAFRDAAGLSLDRPLGAAARMLFHNFEALEAESRWGLTATPTLSSAAEVSFLARFHRVFVPRDSDLEAQHYLDEYVRSNDLDTSSIPIQYHLITVRHTGPERALYLNVASREMQTQQALLQICNFFSPDDRDDDMSSAINTTRCDNELELSKHQAEMEKAQSTIDELRELDRRCWPNKKEEEIRKLKGKLRRLEENLPSMQQKERRLQSRNRYFEEVLKELKELEQASVECPVCMKVLDSDDCNVTACGHKFCKGCIQEWLVDQRKDCCPTCKHPLKYPNGVALAKEVLSRNQEAASQHRIARFGSKLEAVCNQLKSIWNNEAQAKVIIFVQFEVLLRKMEGALKDLGLSCLTLRGTVFERRRVIRQFHASGQENQVLLLSLERSPAGMNLVCCHHLILVHPMLAESRDAALSFERQAIGRVRRQGQKDMVHVYRFFVKETIEEEVVRDHHANLLQGAGEESAAP